MNKISINKASEIEAFRKTKQGEITHTEKTEIQKTDSKKNTSTDNLQFSDKATEFINFVNKLNELPDVREAKVFELRQQIRVGDFNPTNEDIADGILRDEF